MHLAYRQSDPPRWHEKVEVPKGNQAPEVVFSYFFELIVFLRASCKNQFVFHVDLTARLPFVLVLTSSVEVTGPKQVEVFQFIVGLADFGVAFLVVRGGSIITFLGGEGIVWVDFDVVPCFEGVHGGTLARPILVRGCGMLYLDMATCVHLDLSNHECGPNC